MSHLSNTRLVFSGLFQADVSTVNNDVRHYSNADWEPRFQGFENDSTSVENGWWNPVGSGAFRLVSCKITGAHYKDGTQTAEPAKDPAVGLLLAGTNERVAAKLVDIDPQWQLSSEIWGLDVRLSDGTEPPLMRGRFRTSAFRDLIFTRIPSLRADGAASSYFQSVLMGTDWSGAAGKSRALDELRQMSAADSLSIRLMTYGYIANKTDPRFTLGMVCGAIGPYLPNEPRTFVFGRRFVPINPTNSPHWPGASWNGINYFNGWVDEASSTLFLDLANAVALANNKGLPIDIGALTVGALLDPSVQEQGAVTAANFDTFGPIDYLSPDWLAQTSGICSLKLTSAQLKNATTKPLALAAQPSGKPNVIAIREATNGLFACAEDFVQRIDSPGKSGKVTIYAAQFGKPLSGAAVALTAIPPTPDLGGGDPNAPDQPKAPFPMAFSPPNGIAFPTTLHTDVHGMATLTVEGKLGHVSPRGYLDGQIYCLNFGLDGEGPTARAPFEVVVAQVRDAYAVSAKPSWIPHIAPIFTQFNNLYPIMGRRLIDLTDPVAVKSNLKILQLAFSLDITDPNYMPVTRDLSSGKRLAIQRWLARLEVEDDPTFVGGSRPSPALSTAAALSSVPQATAAPHEPIGGKTTFAASLKRGRGRSGK